MNFEVVCFTDGTVAQKKYFDTLKEAIYFENTEGLDYEHTSFGRYSVERFHCGRTYAAYGYA